MKGLFCLNKWSRVGLGRINDERMVYNERMGWVG